MHGLRACACRCRRMLWPPEFPCCALVSCVINDPHTIERSPLGSLSRPHMRSVEPARLETRQQGETTMKKHFTSALLALSVLAGIAGQVSAATNDPTTADSPKQFWEQQERSGE